MRTKALNVGGSYRARLSVINLISTRLADTCDLLSVCCPVLMLSLLLFALVSLAGVSIFSQVFLVREKVAGDIYAMKVLRKDNIIKRNQVMPYDSPHRCDVM